MEQFLLKGDNGSGADRLYRQSKVPSLTLMRLKILINFNRDFQKGLETANYLLTLYPGLENTEGIEERFVLDESVAEHLQLFSDTKRRALYLYLAGLTHMIYAECSSPVSEAKWLYTKVKSTRLRALCLFNQSLEVSSCQSHE